MRPPRYLRLIGLGTELLVYLAVGIGGGYALDRHYDTLPGWTLAGWLIAMVACGYLIYVRLVR